MAHGPATWGEGEGGGRGGESESLVGRVKETGERERDLKVPKVLKDIDIMVVTFLTHYFL